MSKTLYYILNAVLPGTGNALIGSQKGDKELLKRSWWQMGVYWLGVFVACTLSRAVGLPLVALAAAWALWDARKALSAL